MSAFSLEHLTDIEFEHYCFDLLFAIGFKNVSWRKGTGLDASPADQGRDIECDWELMEPGGHKSLEHWFVQAKHFKKGVPPEKLSGALTWASAERPSKLLFIVSNFLSNPAKEYLETYERNNKPPFRIRFWEKPDLARMTSAKLELVRKYATGGDLSYLAILHPAHVAFLKTNPVFSLSRLFSLLDKLETEERESLLFWSRLLFLNPQPDHENQTVGELLKKKASYEMLKQECLEASKNIPGFVIASWIVSSVLSHALVYGDTTMDFQPIIDAREKDANRLAKRLELETEPQNRKSLEKLIEISRGTVGSLSKDAERMYALYSVFCKTVVDPLVAGEKVEQD